MRKATSSTVQTRSTQWLALALLALLTHPLPFFAQDGGDRQAHPVQAVSAPRLALGQDSPYIGQIVRKIEFKGVAAEDLKPTLQTLPISEGKPLTRENLRQALRQIANAALYETLEASVTPENDGIRLTFSGAPRYFIGKISVNGVKGGSLNSILARACQLPAGSRFTQAKLDRAHELMLKIMAQNGYPKATIQSRLEREERDKLADIYFTVDAGPHARIGVVDVTGDSGLSPEDFRRVTKLKSGRLVDHDTANRALANLLRHYQKQRRFEAEIKLLSQVYSDDGQRADFHFSAVRGPIVDVSLIGASLSGDRLKRLLPIFEEGSVDSDLLNEGNRRLRNYYQRQGYYDVKVEHKENVSEAGDVQIRYLLQLGQRLRVRKTTLEGNRYFGERSLGDLLSVHTANTVERYGAYSQALLSADVDALESVYRDNGFEAVKVSSETRLIAEKKGGLEVVYHIHEGEQTRVGAVTIEGNEHVPEQELAERMNTVKGQLLSPRNLTGDRDTLLTVYINRGYDQARVEVEQTPDANTPNRVNVRFRITEGRPLFVRKVLLRGLEHTRPKTVERAILLKPGDPLNQSALAETQRNFYDYALFSEVNTAVVNPDGEQTHKLVLIDALEARRWALTLGFGLEAQTGQPVTNCAGAMMAGVACNPNGKTGVSPRGIINVTRNSLFGREQSMAFQGTYGLLEQKANLIYQSPHFHNRRDLGLSISGGYANSLDVTTYVASKLEGAVRLTQRFSAPGSHFSKAHTFIYEYDFRRVKVDASSLQVYPAAIKSLSSAQRIAGPQITWMRDTRDSPLDARSGSYLYVRDFLTDSRFGAEINFNRFDIANAHYFGMFNKKMVLAINTRYSQERTYGSEVEQLIPLPERIYGGGANSHRGFAINAAGPRDPETGYPIGGAGAFIHSTELRLPPPSLPWLGNSLSFVLFHDMGNVFTNASDIWPSAFRVRQPHQESCKPSGDPNPNPIPDGPNTSTGKQGPCSFDYFSHAPGLGLRYHTPIGPIRLDFSYNLNPPVYPVNLDYSATPTYSNQYKGRANAFNFNFSLGQSF